MSGESMPEKPSTTMRSNDELEALLDAVDNRTARQEQIYNHLTDGFMALARERYRDPSSLERLGHLVYDNREDLRSNVLVKVEQSSDSEGLVSMSRYDSDSEGPKSMASAGLRQRKVGKSVERREGAGKAPNHSDIRNTFIAIPSGELRDAIKHFRLVVDHAIEVVNATNKVNLLLDRMN